MYVFFSIVKKIPPPFSAFSRFSGNYFHIVLDFQSALNAIEQCTKIGKIVQHHLNFFFKKPRLYTFINTIMQLRSRCMQLNILQIVLFWISQLTILLCYVQKTKKNVSSPIEKKPALTSKLTHIPLYRGLWIKDNFPLERNIATRLLG